MPWLYARAPLAAAILGLALGVAAQKKASDIPVETFFKSTRNVITAMESADVADFYWINNDRLCFRLADWQEVSGRFNYRGTYCIDQDGDDLPLIVNVHGGPWVRVYGGADWGRWPEAQFFASRGYVVLEPEPRGSTGWGQKHWQSSFKQWGKAMQDDINDGALHLVQEGLVDRNRMCIHGGTYGGYAAAMGVARDPDFWRCGTPFVAVTDLFLFQSIPYSDISQASDFFQTDFKTMVGDSDADREMFTKQAANVKVPVLLTMGSDDVRVPLAHGDAFRKALETAGKKVEYVVYSGEGHGFNKDENVFDFYRRLEKFFAENLK